MGNASILTRSTSLKFLGEVLRLTFPDSPSNIDILNNMPDVIAWLKLPEQEAARFLGLAETKALE